MHRRDFVKGLALMAGAALLPAPSIAFSATEWVDHWWEGGEEPLPAEEKPGMGVVAAPGKFCDGRLRLRSAIHGGVQEFRFRDMDGNYDRKTLDALNWFLRCKDGTWQYMDVRTIESLNYLSALLGVPEIVVNSGYRSPDYNRKLAYKNENVARNSLHQYGRALDFSVPGIAIKDVCSYALYARNTVGFGGVGYYPKSNFVHLDSGPAKQWVR